MFIPFVWVLQENGVGGCNVIFVLIGEVSVVCVVVVALFRNAVVECQCQMYIFF